MPGTTNTVAEPGLRAHVAAVLVGFAEKGKDDHFYGAWKGGKASQGGGPVTSADVGPDDSRVGDKGVTETNPYPIDWSVPLQPITTGNADGSNIPMRKRLGRCYEFSGRYVMDHRDTTNMVHGSIEGAGNPRIKHAWVEVKDGSGKVTGVYEPITNAILQPASFGAFFNPHVDRRYPAEKALAAMVRTGHYGPWDE